MANRVIIGIDPGLSNTGWGVINWNGLKYEFVAAGTIITDAKTEMQARLRKIGVELKQVLLQYKPTEASIEETFVNKNNLSSLKLGHARGALMLTLALENIKAFEYSATKVKKTLTGFGRAEKQQIDMMIKVLMPKAITKTDHESDALAIAITHANYS
jgi:crossover junction endodeoxyribonuclease RuvC